MATEQSIITCGKCQAVYPIDPEQLGSIGAKVQCEVCGNVWFQRTVRLNSLYSHFELVPYPDDMRKMWTGVNGERKRREGGVVLFVANIPYTCTEQQLAAFFERHVRDPVPTIARDPTGRNRGFGFVEVTSQKDADFAIANLDGTDFQGRGIVVRVSNAETQQSNRERS